MNTSVGFVSDFREAAPYINHLRGKTLVIGVASGLLKGAPLKRLASDLNLLSSLGVRLVMVYGMSAQIEELAEEYGAFFHLSRRAVPKLTDEQWLRLAKRAVGELRCDIEAALCSSTSQSPQRHKTVSIASGNFISAKPAGIVNGIDPGGNGEIRKIDAAAIRRKLDGGELVLIGPTGYTLSGKTLRLDMSDIACAAAAALNAEKLIYVIEQEGILDAENRLETNLSAQEARDLMAQNSEDEWQNRLLDCAVRAVEAGVNRTQILSGLEDGALIRELFTRHGAGTSIARDAFVSIRQAHSIDIPDIIALIRPFEEKGILLRRSRAYLETHINSFFVLEHDRCLYGCVALKRFEQADCAELACLAVSSDAQDGGYGELLLEHVFKQARAAGIRRLFALSTHTGEWFVERGFQATKPEDLPEERYGEYHAGGRHSKVFVYALNS